MSRLIYTHIQFEYEEWKKKNFFFAALKLLIYISFCHRLLKKKMVKNELKNEDKKTNT